MDENFEQALARTIDTAMRAMESAAKLKPEFEDTITRLEARVEWLQFLSKETWALDPRAYEYTTLPRWIKSPIFFVADIRATASATALAELEVSEGEVNWMLGLLGLLFLHKTGMPLPSRESNGERLDDIYFLLRCLGIEVELLVEMLGKRTGSDKLIAVMALGGIAQQSRKVKILEQTGVMVGFGKILIEGPPHIQAEVASVISKLVTINPTIGDKLDRPDLIGSLIELLRVQVAENGVKARVTTMAAKALGVLAGENASVCRIIVEKISFWYFGLLLRDGSLDIQLSSVRALMEITAVVEKDPDLRRSVLKYNPNAGETVDQLMRVIEESFVLPSILQSDQRTPSSTELLIPCIRAIGNLASTFPDTRPVIPLLHLLDSRNYDVCKETLIALTKFASHLDHAKPIASIPGVNHLDFWLSCLGIEEVLTVEGQVQVKMLLELLKEGTVVDKLIAVIILGAIAEQSRKVEQLVEAGVMVVFRKILIEGPMLVRAEVAYVISKFVAIDPTIRGKFAIHDLIGFLVSLLQVEAFEEQSEDDINKATSVLSIVIARHNSNRRKVEDDGNEKSKLGKQIQLPREISTAVKARMKAMAANALGVLAKDNASVCRIIVEKSGVLRFGVLLQDRSLDVKLSSAKALMEITAVAEKDTDLRKSAFKHNLRARKNVVDQLIRIIKEPFDSSSTQQSGRRMTSSPELVIPCIRAIGNLATTFRETRPVISLVRLLGSSKYEVCKEALIALTKFACRENFLHSDHSEAILSLPGVDQLVHLAKEPAGHGELEIQKLALVLLCYVALDAPVRKSYKCKEVVSAIKFASQFVQFSKDETEQAQLLKEAKRRLR